MPEPARTTSATREHTASPPIASDGLIRALRALLVASALIPLVILVGLTWQSRQEAFRNAESAVDEALDVLQEHGLRILDSEDLLLEFIALRTAGMSWSEIERSAEVKAFLRDLDDARDHVSALWLIDADGRLRATSASWPTLPDISGLDFFLAQRGTNVGTFIGRAYGDRALPEFFTVSRKRLSAAGEFDGVIAVAVDVGYFESFFSSVSRGIPHRASLVRTDGEILARIPSERRRPPLPAHDPLMQKMAAADAGVFWADMEGSSTEGVFGHRRMNAYPASVVFGLDAPTVLQPWYRTAALYGGTGAAVSTALALLALIALRLVRRERAAVASLRAETARRAAAEEALHHSQKLEAIGRLSGGIAHDFNNLLTTVIGNLDLIGQRHIDTRARHLAAAALQAAERAASLTEQLLAFARKQRLTSRTIALNRLIAGMSEALSRTAGPRVEIELALAPDLWPVQSDADQIELAVRNIAINARDAMPLGGVLTIETANVRASDLEASLQLASGDYVLLAISDSGSGMSEEVKARAFEPFFTTKEVGKGSGLGLSQVHGIAAQSGGTATVDTRPGVGTTIRIYFPRAGEQPAVDIGATGTEAGSTPTSERPSILLVGDDPQVREFARTCLEDAGYRVVEAAYGPLALELLQSGKIDLLIADFGMNGMNGTQLAEHAHLRCSALPVLLITGHMDDVDDRELGGATVLAKPFRAAQLVERVRAMLAERPQPWRAGPSSPAD